MLKICNECTLSLTHYYPRQTITERIIESVQRNCGIGLKSLKSPKKTRNIADARKVFCYFMRKYQPDLTLTKIGHIINQDHSTVIYSIRQAESMNDNKFRKKFKAVERELKTSI